MNVQVLGAISRICLKGPNLFGLLALGLFGKR